ncbi:SRPBCC family protein [Gymnodinialimonas sp.]
MREQSDQRSESVDFDMTTEWTFRVEPEELTAIVLDPERLDQWCSRVFLKADVIEKGRPDGLGMKMHLHAKGKLPFSFDFFAEITELVRHKSMTITLNGDFEGVGESRSEPIGDGLCISKMRWKVDVHQRQIKPFLFILKPIGRLNHDWAVRRVCMQLQKEIDRRRDESKLLERTEATSP